MEQLHTYHSDKYNVDIDIIEFEHRHFYLKISQLESILNTTFDNWLTKNPDEIYFRTEMRYDQYNYDSAKQYAEEIIKSYNDEKIVADDLIYIFINNFDNELSCKVSIDPLQNDLNLWYKV